MTVISSLFKRVIRLNEADDTPPWVIQLWDDTEHEWRSLGSNTTAGALSSPLLLAVELPDFVSSVGDIIMVDVYRDGRAPLPPPPPPPPPPVGIVTIADAGFETPIMSYPGFEYAPSGSAWTWTPSSGGNGEAGAGITANGTGFSGGNDDAPEGLQVALLQGAGVIAQSISASDNDTYQLTVAASMRVFSELGVPTVLVKIDGVLVDTFVVSNSPHYQDYSTTPFVMTSGAHLLEFVGSPSDSDSTAFLDNIRIVGGM